MPMPRNIGMSYIFGKLRIPAFQWAGGHDRVFVSMVAAPMEWTRVAMAYIQILVTSSLVR